MTHFKAQFYSIEIEFHESTIKQILLEIEEDILDLGLVRTPFIQQGALVLQPLVQDGFVLAVPKNHPLLSLGSCIYLRQAKDYPFVAYNAESVPGLNSAMNGAC